MWKFRSLQKPLVFMSLLCLFPLGAMAQSIIKGTANNDTGDPAIGVTVEVQRSNDDATINPNNMRTVYYHAKNSSFHANFVSKQTISPNNITF